jgi:hypothetical protein
MMIDVTVKSQALPEAEPSLRRMHIIVFDATPWRCGARLAYLLHLSFAHIG